MQLVKLRRHIEEVASKEPYMGEKIPLCWLKFEHAVSQLVEEGTNFSSLDQVIIFCDILSFYHERGEEEGLQVPVQSWNISFIPREMKLLCSFP